MPPRKVNKKKEIRILNWQIAGVILLTFLTYLPALSNGFVNWDDIVYVFNNDMISSFSLANLGKMFSSFFQGNYHPFSLLSLSFDYHIFQFKASGYHFHNLVIHLINTFLVYKLFIEFLDKDVKKAALVALLFALHPLHVESVAWVSERKDLLYTMYYLMAVIAYIRYLADKKMLYYYLVNLFFVFSLFSKGQAVTLPVALLVVDYFRSRKFNLVMLTEKIPMFALSVIFGIVAIAAQKENSYFNPLNVPFWQSVFYAPYGLGMYIVKFVFPVFQTIFYEYPVTSGGGLPPYIYASPLVIIGMILLIVQGWEKSVTTTFGILFFLATILPVLQFLPVGKAVMAERYSYIPYIGLSVVAVHLFYMVLSKYGKGREMLINIAGSLVLLFFIFQTYSRTQVWKDSYTLWNDVIDKNPACVNAYMNLAFLYNMDKKYDSAVIACNRCLKTDTSNALIYKNRAIALNNTGNYNLAREDYSKAIMLDPKDKELLMYRGILYTDKLKNFDLAIQDFRNYLSSDPLSEKACFNLSVAFFYKTMYDSSRYYCRKVIKINPENGYAANLLTSLETLTHEKERK